MELVDINNEFDTLSNKIDKLEEKISRLKEQLQEAEQEKKQLDKQYKELENLQKTFSGIEAGLSGTSVSQETLNAIEQLKKMVINSVKEGKIRSPHLNSTSESYTEAEKETSGSSRRRSEAHKVENNKYVCYYTYPDTGEFNYAYIGFLGSDSSIRRDRWKEYLSNEYPILRDFHDRGDKRESNALGDTARHLEFLNKTYNLNFSPKNGHQLKLFGITEEQIKEIASKYDFTKYPNDQEKPEPELEPEPKPEDELENVSSTRLYGTEAIEKMMNVS